MTGEVMYGKCDVCGKNNYLKRTYYHYGFKCDCHGPDHFELIDCCNDCTPKRPMHTKITLTDEQACYIGKAVAFYEKHKEDYKDE